MPQNELTNEFCTATAGAPSYDFLIKPPLIDSMASLYTGIKSLSDDDYVLIKVSDSNATWWEFNAWDEYGGGLMCILDYNLTYDDAQRKLIIDAVRDLSLKCTSDSTTTRVVTMTYYSSGRDTSWIVKSGRDPV